jgi:hypothetical protein
MLHDWRERRTHTGEERGNEGSGKTERYGCSASDPDEGRAAM